MLYNGKPLVANVVDVFLPRGGDEVIHVRAGAVLNYDKFHKICPIPTPPMKILRGGKKEPDFDHPSYLADINRYGMLKMRWMFIESLKATPEFEWQTVKEDDPSTWEHAEKELEQAGFSEFERQHIMGAVTEANALNEKKLEEARERFTKGLVAAYGKSISHQAEASTTPNGEPQNGQASDSLESQKAPGTN